MSRGTILIADDDRVFTEMLRTKLHEKGFHVLVAYDAMQAVMFAVQSGPDLILLDVKMPGGTGLEAIRQLKISNKTYNIPVIAVSAVDNPKLPDVIKGLGAIGFIAKPVNFKAVYKLICSVLSLKRDQAADVASSPVLRDSSH
jgi:DNA-binding response OmpR family regulator